MEAIAADTSEIQKRELSPIIVSSGAIGFGARALALDSRPRKVEVHQACAAVGQPILMRHWQQARIINGDEIGTLFMAGSRVAARTRWILGARAKGRIHVDDGAMEAIRKKKACFPAA